MREFDALIIGFGKAGKTLALALAGAGKTVALVERSNKMYGGTCINIGCIPSKSLKTSAERKIENKFFEAKAKYYQESVGVRGDLTELLRNANYHKLADNELIEVIDATASFTSDETVILRSEETQEEVKAKQYFINTGASPRISQVKGAQSSPYVLNSTTLMTLESLPENLVILGGGYIGLEFACMYANFGSKVTVLQRGNTFLPKEDRDIADSVLERIKQLGVRVEFNAQATEIIDKEGYAQINVEAKGQKLELQAQAILVATGRVANTAELNLAAVGVKVNEAGFIITDEHLRTDNKNIFAMGDVAGSPQFTYVSLDDYRIVRSAVLGDASRTTKNRGALPHAVFIDPPLSRVGLTESEARELGYEVKVAVMNTINIPKARVLRETAGMLKAVVDAKTGQILGAYIFAAESHEVINILKLAIDAKLDYRLIRDQIFTHPTMAEGLNDLFAMI